VVGARGAISGASCIAREAGAAKVLGTLEVPAMLRSSSPFLFLALLVLTACGPETPTGAQIELTVVLVDATAEPLRPLPGIEVCVHGHPDLPCAESDADGRIAMRLPASSEILLRCEGAGYGPAYMTWTIGTEDIDAGRFNLIPTASQDALVLLSGARSWWETGAVGVNVYDELVRRDTRVAGATFTIDPVLGGPTYLSELRRPDPSLTASTVGGPGIFYDIPDGTEVVVTIHHPTRACRAGLGWATGSETSLRTQVFAGGISFITFVCPPEE
jgi:hypothetical protein